MDAFLFKISTLLIPVTLAIVFHEAAHGYVAWRCGDDTAYREGRVTLNPLRHIDPLGTLIVPALLVFTTGFLFGWAKPVPVAFHRLNQPKRDMVWVALAGPAINIVLAFFSAWLLKWQWWVSLLPDVLQQWVIMSLTYSLLINVVLAVFNMLPLPPLDGGRIAVGLLPFSLARPLAQLEPYGFIILLLLLFVLPMVGNLIGLNLSIFHWIIVPLVYNISEFLIWLTS